MYTIVRIIITLILLLIVFMVYGKTIKKNGNKKIIAVISLMIFFALLWIPFENYVMSFKSPTAVFKYQFFNKDIVKLVENENSAYIIYSNDGTSLSFESFEKKNGSWKLENIFSSNKIDFKTYNEYNLANIQTKNNSQNLIIVSEVNRTEQASNIKVSDNLNSKFNTFLYKYKDIDYNTTFYYTIIDSQTKSYKLSINDKVIN